ncbi:hypothetical protein IN07_09600 [Modestobacter caceresii]|uniref:OmpR/PhoB-type domain-containing protein n=1 Tax=Modestobacter caceresii TaxID=1522368 RepID=A0A098Y8X6_9ACTN|nr:hypothetical protein IN07_09600 [Modestobacter caceresii]
MRLRVLGPVTAEDDAGPLDLKGPRHRAVLARLLVARGRAVPLHRLVDDLWDDAPDGAAGAVQTFVGALRKALEPDRLPRTPPRLLVTVAGGYALRTDPGAVDADRFEAAVARATDLLDDGRPDDARAELDEALALWRGPAYADVADQPWARAEAGRLEETRLLVLHRRAEAGLAGGDPAAVVPELEALLAEHPLREDTWALLALARYRAGRQGDALATLRHARTVLLRELGVDPGPGLRQLEADVLAQAAHLSRSSPRPPSPVEPAPRWAPGLVGRDDELTALTAAAATAAGGRPQLALVSGAAGAGKTALVTALADRLRTGAWTVAWGAGPEVPGAPPAWPWTQLGAQLGVANDPAAPADPATARFRRHRALADALVAASQRAPVLVVLDDLHWADEDTLALLGTLLPDLTGGRVLVVGTYRATDVSPGLTETLGRLARAEPLRLYLGGLTERQTAELVAGLTDRGLSDADVRLVHARSAGNPFLARELVRLYDSGGPAALRTVPAGVRDVVRQRVGQLPEVARTQLRQAAVQGQDVDLEVLAGQVGDEEAVLATVESALLAGLLVEDGRHGLRFEHALVQEALYADVPRVRRTRWHATVATLVEQLRPDDAPTIAHHLLRAEDQAPPGRTAHHAREAARRAERRAALHEAATLWRGVLGALDRLPDTDPRERLEARTGLVRALAVTGDLRRARQERAVAVQAADQLGDPALTAAVVGSSDVPAIWTTNDDEALSAQLVEVAERTLTALPADRRAERARLLVTIALERRADAGPRGDQAAREAERIARGLGDPGLLALALDARFLQSTQRAGLAPERARIGEELVALTRGDDSLTTFAVLGHLVLLQSRCALGDLTAADRHAGAADALADRHGLPVVGVFTDWYAALRLAVSGRTDEARAAYRTAAVGLAGTGMTGLEHGLLPLALLSLDPGLDPTAVGGLDWGPHEPWARPLALLRRGDRAGAAAALDGVPESPRDLLLEVRCCLAARAAVELGDRARMAQLYDQLLPAADELAGAGSGPLTVGPAALHLAGLAAGLGRAADAAAHHRQALAVAERAGAAHWASAARAARAAG